MKRNTIAITITTMMLLVLVAMFIIPSGIAPHANIGPNYKNVTVWTHVNITNAKPEVLVVNIYEASANATLRNITVTAGDTKRVYCNATVRDWNGFNDITYLNASIWHNVTSNYTDADDNNSHYTNVSCTYNESVSANIGWYVCSFDVYYYANNGTWLCNATVMDTYNKTGFLTNSTSFVPVYALNVTDGIDYGELAVEDTSPTDIVANVTNIGNMGINFTLESYGVRKGDGLAMNCSIAGNITAENQRFSIDSGVPYGSKTPLNRTSAVRANLTIPKQTVPGSLMVNSTYWQLYIPPNPAGNCTGYVIFTATAP